MFVTIGTSVSTAYACETSLLASLPASSAKLAVTSTLVLPASTLPGTSTLQVLPVTVAV